MIDIRYFRFVFAFIMALFMSLIISGVLTYVNLGFADGFFGIWMAGYAKALAVAYPSILVIAPLTTKITKAICVDKSQK